jgi:aminoglycoside phosphotransferase (APT) family kinase protein
VAEIEVDEAQVRALLRAQHRDLADRALRHVDAGFDNQLWRLGDDLVVRLPRRAVAADLAVNEHRWLPELAHRLPLPVPVPLRLGRPTDDFPWPWAVVPWLAGVPADREPPADAAGAAGQLGEFQRALHRPAAADAPVSPWRSPPLAHRAATFDERLAAVGDHVAGLPLRRVWDEATAAPPAPGPASWVHGDLHPANVLVAAGRLAGVLDFGDLCAGDPAVDVAGLWLLLPRTAHERFWEAYGGTDDVGLGTRARGWAVLLGLMLLEIGLRDRPSYAAVGRRALESVVAAAT